ncbi:MAG: zinc metalloprotease HtpX [Gemmatimonadetes bacterium]|nr:zinc metalloprotease HtpX [Gemmatimonadota bacterium]MBI2403576.1 zinc metalloprotease HtpX [Gemmatimonadota bacterium]MBI2536086.1 zinc metalloprotease HtpX [Gemmatimonadota bacterium]MBI2614447.1 zinc metalloprotease HtpX [Gemmatimonadota bacterium]
MKNTAKTALLLGFLSALLLIVGQAVGGQQGLIVAFVFAVLLNFGSYWFSDKLVLRMYRAKEVGAEHPLSRIVARLVQRASLPMPKVYIIPTDALNAFATGRDPAHAAVAATEGIIANLSERELEGVMAHELAHVKHRDTLISAVAATIAAAIMMLAYMARWGAIFGGLGGRDNRGGGGIFTLLATAIVAPIAAMLIQAAISRSREFGADRGGAEIAGSPQGLADALRKLEVASKQLPLQANPATAHLFIVQPFAGQGIISLFSTHPPTQQRVARLLGR